MAAGLPHPCHFLYLNYAKGNLNMRLNHNVKDNECVRPIKRKEKTFDNFTDLTLSNIQRLYAKGENIYQLSILFGKSGTYIANALDLSEDYVSSNREVADDIARANTYHNQQSKGVRTYDLNNTDDSKRYAKDNEQLNKQSMGGKRNSRAVPL